MTSKRNHWWSRKDEACCWVVCNHFEIVKQDSLYSSVQRMVCDSVLKESCSSFRLLSCFWKGRHFETGVSFSRGHVSEFEHCSRVSQRTRPSLRLCLESRLGQNRCVEGVEAGCMGGSLCSGGDVMNRSAESCVYQWLCSE